MNKILKFRCWNNQHQYFVNPDSFGYMSVMLRLDGAIFQESNRITNEVTTWTIQQFTGMIDKNNKPIYEGDIVKTYVYDGWFDVAEAKTCNYEIKWSNFDYGWRGFTEFMMVEEFAGVTFNLTETEVIGNIFENKELL